MMVTTNMYSLFLAPILFFSCVSCSFQTDYYENLINEKTAEAVGFVIPTSNDEFLVGSNSNVTNDFGVYDFIIVGAGSSGSVLATRLSEVDDFNILLLEAGGEEDDFSNVPAMCSDLPFSDMNWGYYSTPQTTSCLEMKDRRCMIPRGKVVGGSSSINGGMYVRGNPNDYDNWADLGNPGWSYKDVLPYFHKTENSQIDGDVGYHGKDGFWNVEYALPPSKLFANFINASEQVGVSILDYNGQTQVGSSQVQYNIKQGKRQSTGTAFLSSARRRKNLNVVTKSLATRIIIDSQTKVAQGIEFVTRNQKFSAVATKEVIVSGGAINSPQLLMLSGIGPRDHLDEMGIKVLADLPVGKNLLEHPLFYGLRFHTNYTESTKSLKSVVEQFLRGYGPLTNAGRIDGIGFLHTGHAPTNTPTIEYLFLHSSLSNQGVLGKIYRGSDFSMLLVLLHEKSRGRITLKSSDPIDFPNIDLNMLAEQEDVDNLIEGIEFVLNLTKTDSFKAIDAELINIPICTQFTKYSKQYWECVIHQMTTTIHHPCGTTPMGSDKTTSVVDNNLKVYGIEHLRVVDAGVFPTTISGHTNAPAIMVAEKIADVIKSDYNRFKKV